MDLTRPQWLAKRKKSIGASDAAMVLGVSPYGGPQAVYLDKTTEEINERDSKWMAYGRDIEGAIAKMYMHETDMVVRDLGATHIVYHPDYKWIGSTLDRVVGGLPLELKSVGQVGVYSDTWIESVPLHIQIQLQIQMACMDADRGVVAALFPGYQLVHKTIKRDERFLQAAYPVLESFWHENVLAKVPPPADSTPHALECVKRLYNKDNGETVELTKKCLQNVENWRRLKTEKRQAEKEIKELEKDIRDEMKEACYGKMEGGEILTLKTTKRKAYSREIKAGEYRTLRIKKVEE